MEAEGDNQYPTLSRTVSHDGDGAELNVRDVEAEIPRARESDPDPSQAPTPVTKAGRIQILIELKVRKRSNCFLTSGGTISPKCVRTTRGTAAL